MKGVGGCFISKGEKNKHPSTLLALYLQYIYSIYAKLYYKP